MQQNSKLRLSTAQLFTAIVILSLFAMAAREVLDADFWWHLETGNWIVENFSIPKTDPFSQTKFGEPWIAHEWLSEVIFYGIFKIGGLGLLSILFSIVITASFALSYSRSDGKPYLAGFVTILGALASAPLWGVRPQMISLLFFSGFLLLLDKYTRTSNKRYLYFLPVIMLLWVNLHAGYMLGPAVILIYIAGSCAEAVVAVLNKEKPSWTDLKAKVLPELIILVLCLVASMANPNGLKILIYPFQTLSSNAMMSMIVEWFSPDFHKTEWLPLIALTLLLIASGLYSKKQSSITEILLACAFGFGALRSMRNVPLFAIAIIPILSYHIDGIVNLKLPITTPTRRQSLLNIFLLAIAALVVCLRIDSVITNQKVAEEKAFPATATNWIKEDLPDGNIFNSYGWGGYLIWNLYPKYKVFIDGRADLYGDSFMSTYNSIYYAQTGWKDKLDQANIRIVLVEPTASIASALQNDNNWKVVLQNDKSILLVKTDEK